MSNAQLPHQPPFVMQANVTPQFQQFAPSITGWAMLEAINSAQRTPLRGFYVQALSQNGWQNQLFQTLVNATGQLAEFLIATNKARDPMQAIQAAAGECMAMLTAVWAQQNQQVFQQLRLDQNGMNQINQLLQKFQAIDQQISQFYGSLANPAPPQYNSGYGAPAMGYQPPPSTGYGGTPVGGGYNAPRGGYNPPFAGHHPHTPPPSGNPLLAGSNRTNHAPAPVVPSVPTIPSGMTVMGASTGGIMEQLHMSEPAKAQRNEVTPMRRGELTAFVPGQVAVTPSATPVTPVAPTLQPVPEQSAVSQPAAVQWLKFGTLEWPKVRDLSRPYDSMLFEDGTEVQAAVVSNWTRTWSREIPYAASFNPDTHIRLLAMSTDGNVSEKIVEKDETMRYLDHELNRAAAGAQAASDKRDENIPADLTLLNSLRNIDQQPLSVPAKGEELEETAEVVDGAKAVKVTEGIVADTMENTHGKLNLLLSKNDVEADAPYEYYVDLVKTVMVTKDIVPVVKGLADTDTYMGLASKVAQLDDSSLIAAIDDRMTDTINRAIQKNLGLRDWSIDSWLNDYEELVVALKEQYGEDFIKIFEEYAVDVIGGALAVSDDERHVNYGRNKLGLTAEELEPSEFALICFVSRCSITQVPWTEAELQIDLIEGDVSTVRASELPELRKALDAIMTRTEDFPLVHANRYLVTADERVLEIYRGYLAKDSILLGYSALSYNEL